MGLGFGLSFRISPCVKCSLFLRLNFRSVRTLEWTFRSSINIFLNHHLDQRVGVFHNTVSIPVSSRVDVVLDLLPIRELVQILSMIAKIMNW